MSVIAISENLGSQGDEIGRELARALGLECADREIIAKAAERYGEGVLELHHVTEERPTIWERFTDSKRHYLCYVEATIFEMAARDGVVLVGHGAAVMLRAIPHVLRVRVTAPERVRAERVRQQQGLTEAAALEFVRETDGERNSRIKFLYHVDLEDPLLYDLVINTDRFTVADGVHLVREALVREALAGGRRQPTEQSRTLAQDLSLVAEAKARLVMSPTTRNLRLALSAANGSITVTGTVDSEGLQVRALEVIGQVPGVVGVVNKVVVLAIAMPRSFPRG